MILSARFGSDEVRKLLIKIFQSPLYSRSNNQVVLSSKTLKLVRLTQNPLLKYQQNIPNFTKKNVFVNAIPVLCMKLKQRQGVFQQFFDVDLYSAKSMESSRRDLLNDMAEHTPILKNNQNTHHPRLGFTLKTGIAFPKTGFFFLLRFYISR